jgi:hypothetical protein
VLLGRVAQPRVPVWVTDGDPLAARVAQAPAVPVSHPERAQTRAHHARGVFLIHDEDPPRLDRSPEPLAAGHGGHDQRESEPRLARPRVARQDVDRRALDQPVDDVVGVLGLGVEVELEPLDLRPLGRSVRRDRHDSLHRVRRHAVLERELLPQKLLELRVEGHAGRRPRGEVVGIRRLLRSPSMPVSARAASGPAIRPARATGANALRSPGGELLHFPIPYRGEVVFARVAERTPAGPVIALAPHRSYLAMERAIRRTSLSLSGGSPYSRL